MNEVYMTRDEAEKIVMAAELGVLRDEDKYKLKTALIMLEFPTEAKDEHEREA